MLSSNHCIEDYRTANAQDAFSLDYGGHFSRRASSATSVT